MKETNNQLKEILQNTLACYQTGSLKQAEEQCKLALRIEPRSSEALHMLSVISLNKMDIGKASGFIDKAIEYSQGFIELLITRGDVYAAQHKLNEAVLSYQKAIQIKPDLIEAYFNMGNAFYRMEKYDSAIFSYESALKIKPGFSNALNNLGLAYHAQNNSGKAISCFNQALHIDPDNADVHNNLGNSLHDEGKAKDAIRSYLKTVELNPDHFYALYNLGNSYQELGNFEQAIYYYNKSISKNPENINAYINLGKAYHVQGDIDRAIQTYEEAATLKPDTADLYFFMGNALLDQFRIDEAITCYKKAISLDPDHSETYINLGNGFHSQDNFDEAIACYKKAIKINPDFAEAHNNLGKVFADRLSLDKAILHYQNALKLKSDYAEAHFNYSTALLLSEDLKQGFKEFEWRFKKSGRNTIYPHELKNPRWDGSPFRGKRILVHSEQGLGDTIQFIRYLPLVKAKGGTVIFEVRESLYTLLEAFPGVDQIETFSFTKKCIVPHDFHIPLMSLPKLFGTTLKTIPAKNPYIHAAPCKTNKWKVRIGETGYKVGIVWTGSPTFEASHLKACSLKHFARLAEIQEVQLLGLQKGDAATKYCRIPETARIDNLGPELKDFSDTAAVIENLDLVISIDTSVAHLAGAMGKPVWTLLPFSPDWRWMLGRDDSPWYPSMRLFRQPEPGDWDSVFLQVETELKAILKQKKWDADKRR